jgi:hypothetical protein
VTPEKMSGDRPPKCLRQKYKTSDRYSSLCVAWKSIFGHVKFEGLEDPLPYLRDFAEHLRRHSYKWDLARDAAGYIEGVTSVFGVMRASMRAKTEESK